MSSEQAVANAVKLDFTRPEDDSLLMRLAGAWRLEQKLPSAAVFDQQVSAGSRIHSVAFDTTELTAWDTGLLNFLAGVTKLCRQREIAVDDAGLPEGVRRLLDLAFAVPEKKDARKDTGKMPLLAQIGTATTNYARGAPEMLQFIGESSLAFMRLFRGKARFRKSDLFLTIQECGPQALPIVSLISFLIGLILAYMGAVQLQQFGAQIYVADLVALGMVREMGAMMTGIIMAGRTGAAFAAQLGTMQVNQEIDAFESFGIPAMDFLVLPRMLALMLMVPLLTLYADLVGILAGLLVGVSMLDLGLLEYYNETVKVLNLRHFGAGLFKSVVFGALIAIAGCLRGMQSGRSASAVGDATTSAVVTGIVFIIVASSILTVVYQAVGI